MVCGIYDTPAAPVLLDIVVDGRPIKAVAQVTKQSFCFVFDRVSGKPVWQIDELPVPPSTVPGEHASPTLPFPTWPLPFDRQGVSEDDLIDFTPELKAEALEIYNRYDHGPLFSPPSLTGALTLPAAGGGGHWGGAAANPTLGYVFILSRTAPRRVWLTPTHQAGERPAYAAEMEDMEVFNRQLSLVKPPYGRITAIDLNSGEQMWMRALGKGDVNHPEIRHLDLPDMGVRRYMFAIATPNLVLVAPIRASWGGDFYRDRTSYLWALDPRSGEKVGQVPLSRGTGGSLMTYEAGGRQYIVYPTGRGPNSALVALAIPRPGEALPFQALGRDDADHELYYEAVAAFDAGDEVKLKQLLADDRLASARGYLHEDSEPDFFRGATLLHHVAGNPQRAELQDNVLELTRILLQAGADPNAETADSNSVLGLVIGADQLRWLKLKSEMIELLLEAGADADQGNGRLLHTALTDRHSGEIARLFYANGAKIDLRFAAALNLMAEVEAFFEADGSLRSDAVSCYHPLPNVAAQMGDQEILNESFNYAASWGNLEIAAFLLDRGAEINSKPPKVYWPGDRGRSALHAAVDGERPEMVRFLLARGADQMVRDNNWDDTPLDWARWGGNEEIVQVLRETPSKSRPPAEPKSD